MDMLAQLFLSYWLVFMVLVITILAIDLGLSRNEAHEVSMKESAILAGSCMTLGVAFSAVVWWLYYHGYAQSLDEDIAGAATPLKRAWTAWEL